MSLSFLTDGFLTKFSTCCARKIALVTVVGVNTVVSDEFEFELELESMLDEKFIFAMDGFEFELKLDSLDKEILIFGIDELEFDPTLRSLLIDEEIFGTDELEFEFKFDSLLDFDPEELSLIGVDDADAGIAAEDAEPCKFGFEDDAVGDAGVDEKDVLFTFL